MIRRAASYVLAGFLLAWLFAGCATSTRDKTLAITLAATETAQHTFQAYDHQHELDIAREAKDRAAGDAALLGWHVERDKVDAGLLAVYEAIAVAKTVNDDTSVAGAVRALADLKALLAALGVKP